MKIVSQLVTHSQVIILYTVLHQGIISPVPTLDMKWTSTQLFVTSDPFQQKYVHSQVVMAKIKQQILTPTFRIMLSCSLSQGTYSLPFLGCQKKKKVLVLLAQTAHGPISSFYLWKKISLWNSMKSKIH